MKFHTTCHLYPALAFWNSPIYFIHRTYNVDIKNIYEKSFVVNEGKSEDSKTDQIYSLVPSIKAFDTQGEKIRLDFYYS